MALTRTFAAGREQCFQQIDKLIKSHSLHGSESLCKLLRYLAEHSLDHPGTALKEYQIATEVLGRPAGFDPQSDSTVRVQAGRLRVKLAEYYANEGPDDPIVVEIPKGSYALTFHLRPPKPGTQSATTLVFEPGVKKKEEQSPSIRGWAIAVVVLDDRLPAFAARAHPGRCQPTRPCPLSDFLESFRHFAATALGHLQQCQLRWASEYQYALLQRRF